MRYKRVTRYGRPTSAEMREFQKFLGPLARRYTSSQLIQLRSEMHEMAQILVDMYLENPEKYNFP